MKREAKDHPKFKLVARDLKLPLCYVRGIVESIWLETGVKWFRGDIGTWPNDEIAAAIDYPGDPDELIRVLVKRRLLDEIPGPGRLYVHDWHEHCDRHINLRILRARTTYANGSPPRKKESNDQADEPEETEQSVVRRKRATVRTISGAGAAVAPGAQMNASDHECARVNASDHECGQKRDMFAPPEPAPEPAPEPVPEPVPERAAAAADPPSAQMTSDIPQVLAALGRFGLATAPTARKLISDCRARSPDVSASEICVFVQEAVESLRSRKNLHSPMGLLLRIVNEQCDPTSLFEYRQRVQRAQAQAARVQAQKRESLMAEYRACLASPELPESERAYITEFLRDNEVELPVN